MLNLKHLQTQTLSITLTKSLWKSCISFFETNIVHKHIKSEVMYSKIEIALFLQNWVFKKILLLSLKKVRLQAELYHGKHEEKLLSLIKEKKENSRQLLFLCEDNQQFAVWWSFFFLFLSILNFLIFCFQQILFFSFSRVPA